MEGDCKGWQIYCSNNLSFRDMNVVPKCHPVHVTGETFPSKPQTFEPQNKMEGHQIRQISSSNNCVCKLFYSFILWILFIINAKDNSLVIAVANDHLSNCCLPMLMKDDQIWTEINLLHKCVFFANIREQQKSAPPWLLTVSEELRQWSRSRSIHFIQSLYSCWVTNTLLFHCRYLLHLTHICNNTEYCWK